MLDIEKLEIPYARFGSAHHHFQESPGNTVSAKNILYPFKDLSLGSKDQKDDHPAIGSLRSLSRLSCRYFVYSKNAKRSVLPQANGPEMIFSFQNLLLEKPLNFCYSKSMTLTFNDEERIRHVVQEEVHDEVKTQLTEFRSDLITKLDKIIGIVEKQNQELTILSKRSIDQAETLEDHEARLTKVESKLLLTSA